MDAQGSLNSLLGRLTAVLVDEAQLLGGLRSDVEFINDEMKSMKALLMHLTGSSYRDHQVQLWMEQVGCVSRDCEGNIELYLRYVSNNCRHEGALGYLWRIPRFLRTMPARHRIAKRIRELKDRARDVGDRRQRYGVTVPSGEGSGSRIVTDKPVPLQGGPEEDLRRRELLFDEPPPLLDDVEQCTKRALEWFFSVKEYFGPYYSLVSIEGFAGTGKTSVARKMLEHPSFTSLFDCMFWINCRGSRRPIEDILMEIVEQQLLREPSRHSARSVEDRVTWAEKMAGELLYRRRLLVVLDDTYMSTCLQLFKKFADYGCTAGSAVIATLDDIEEFCYTAEYIDRRYRRKAFVCEGRLRFFEERALTLAKCGFGHIRQIIQCCSHDIFALQILLHLLYMQPNRDTSELMTLLGTLKNNRNTTAKKMLIYSYEELPSNYRSCLLYLSIFPQAHMIQTTDLLRRWVAEGLVTKTGHGMGCGTLDDQARRIFDSLVNRGFIRPGETSATGKIKSCTVNLCVHEFITAQLNFVDTLPPPLADLAHRFSINSGVATAALDQEQSPAESDPPGHGILPLLERSAGSVQWHILKVLDLQGCKGLKKKHLKNICNILLLRYLSLRNTDVSQLPKQIAKLQCLETLDIRQTMVRAFATKSIMLPMLKHLLAGGSKTSNRPAEESLPTAVRLPRGIRRMKTLEILSQVEVSLNVNDIIGIGQLLRLRKLGVILHDEEGGGLRLLLQQIENLHQSLRSLSIQMKQPTKSEGTLASPPKLLESLNISGITGGLPPWIAELNQLTKITLSQTSLSEDAIRVIGKLRILCCLRLLQKSYTEHELRFNQEKFNSLKSLVIEGSDITSIAFDAGSAPKLEMIVWSSELATESLSLSGADELPRLKKLERNGNCAVFNTGASQPSCFQLASCFQLQRAASQAQQQEAPSTSTAQSQKQEAPTASTAQSQQQEAPTASTL